MLKINNLHDLVEFGIKVHRIGVPKGFIISIKLNTKKREKLYSDLLDMTDFDGVPIYLKNGETFHEFTLLNMKFHVF